MYPSPRCDGYVVRDGDRMTAEEAERYHYNQVKVLSDGGVDYVMFACTVYHKICEHNFLAMLVEQFVTM